MPVSEVAQIRKQIANEYMAAKWGLSGLAYGTSKHQFITMRMERIAEGQEELAASVGQEQATVILAETLASLPEKPERIAILEVVEHMQGNTEATVHLFDSIREIWETLDLLIENFGQDDAYKIIMAPGPSFSSERS